VLPASVPPGTTPRSFLTSLLPAEHARLVPARAGRARVLVRVGDEHLTLSADGDHLAVSEVEPDTLTNEADGAPDVAVFVDEATFVLFLEDWIGPRRWLPRFEPREVALLTDARLLRRIGMVTGTIELAIDDFDGSRVSVRLAAGARATAARESDAPPDVTVELSMDTFERLLAGTLAPDEALADRHVSVRGKTLVAMQFALALVPFFPPK
jgi:hypothetical protein